MNMKKYLKYLYTMAIVVCASFMLMACDTSTSNSKFDDQIAVEKVSVENVKSISNDNNGYFGADTITTDKNFAAIVIKVKNTTGQNLYIDNDRISLDSKYTISDKVTASFGTYTVNDVFVLSWNTTISSGNEKSMMLIFETPETVTSGSLSLKFQVQGGNGDVTKTLSFDA